MKHNNQIIDYEVAKVFCGFELKVVWQELILLKKHQKLRDCHFNRVGRNFNFKFSLGAAIFTINLETYRKIGFDCCFIG